MEHKWARRHTCEDAQLFVTLDKPAYNDGDTISVDVRLVVMRPLAIHHMLVELHCQEVIEWRRFSSLSAREDTSVLRETARVLPLEDEDREFAPGEYHFQAEFSVRVGLPRFTYERDNCVAGVQTFVQCLLWTTSNPKRAKLTAGQNFTMTATHPELVAEANYDATLEAYIRFLFVHTAVVPRVIRLQLDRPGLVIDSATTATITIYPSIAHTAMPKDKIKKITLTLFEDATFHCENKKPTSTAVQTWCIPLDSLIECEISSTETGEAQPRPGLKCDMSMRLEASTVHQAITLKLLTISHRIRLEIAYFGGLSSAVEFEGVPVLVSS